MKKIIIPIIVLLLIVGMGYQNRIVYSNLNDLKSQELLSKLMKDTILKSKQEILFQHIYQINEVFKNDELSKGFEPLRKENKYDPYEIQARWDKKHPEFLGYNCRITAFSLFSQYIEIQESKPIKEAVPLDLYALQEDNSALKGEEQKFARFYEDIETTMTKDIEEHVNTIHEEWKKRGIVFSKQDKVSLISVFFHSDIDDENVLQIGHTGLLFDDKDGLYFFEKLAFQEPYQLIKFKNRKQLSKYLMEKYDVNENQPVSRPFIFENDRLLK